MSEAEKDHTIAALLAQIDDLDARIADLELRVTSGHNCSVDLCDQDDSGDCRLAPMSRGGAA